MTYFFFFSSRRRHTRLQGDWSSDVCSSDLRTQVVRVLHRVGEVGLFGRHEVPQVRLHRGQIRLLLRIRELRNRDRGQDADDHDHDQKLDQCKALTVHLNYLPLRSKTETTLFRPRTSTNHALDGVIRRKQNCSNTLTVWKDISHPLQRGRNSGFLQSDPPDARRL